MWIGQSTLTPKQGTCAVGARAGLAQRRTSGRARAAVTAGGNKGKNHVVVNGEICYSRTDLDDITSCFMSENHRQRTWTLTVDDRQVRMAEPGRRNADANFARPGRGKVYCFNLERTGTCVRGRQTALSQNCRTDFHRRGSIQSACSPSRNAASMIVGLRVNRSTKTCTNQPSAAACPDSWAKIPIP